MTQPQLPEAIREEAEESQDGVRGIRQKYTVRYRARQRQEIEEEARRVGDSAVKKDSKKLVDLHRANLHERSSATGRGSGTEKYGDRIAKGPNNHKTPHPLTHS